uniref:Uncharacterized protein n=1 Tax=Octactis speculum TaxID=3111310 RepID=A0A7S2E0P3_9STRA
MNKSFFAIASLALTSSANLNSFNKPSISVFIRLHDLVHAIRVDGTLAQNFAHRHGRLTIHLHSHVTQFVEQWPMLCRRIDLRGAPKSLEHFVHDTMTISNPHRVKYTVLFRHHNL